MTHFHGRVHFYDHPRALSRPRPKKKKPLSKAEVAENSELSSTTDDNTSLLEHQELTPLLSSSTNEENEEHEANSPLPEDPFPLGLNTDVNDGSEDNKGISIGGDPLSFEAFAKCILILNFISRSARRKTSLSASNEPVTAPVEEKECALRASSFSIEEIPMTPISLSSAFNPSEFRTLYLPKEGNKPLDPTAINAVQRTLLDTESDVLAYHLTKLDMDLLSITLNREYGLPGIKSGLHLLTLVEGKQLREDLMERCLCLKYFILTTILTATSKEQSVALMAKWISIASELSNNLLRGITSIWRKLNENYPEDSSCLEHELKSKLKILNEGKFEEIESSESSFIVIPHIIPFLSGCKDLRGLKTFRNLFNEIFKFSKGVPIPEPFPLFNSHIAYAQEMFLREVSG
ncbi:unnamed protein product [Lepeophtheirus salmonis]|uniref:(salmon louse) hypothetical protein n=1 Tax=Lepeophtheirus salmonis TaxID=72036 RepID=A0A7R8CC89_LEPSM|nr:unnamed protein product [Lepeophtheirus salmonis]CAF2768516.1 unnamed protein product [Lepeophtheirus salmonis]